MNHLGIPDVGPILSNPGTPPAPDYADLHAKLDDLLALVRNWLPAERLWRDTMIADIHQRQDRAYEGGPWYAKTTLRPKP